MLVKYLIALLALTCAPAFAQTWHDPEGNAIPESESRKSSDGFSGMLLVTAGKDWREKWDTPPDVIPNFTAASKVERGGQLAILIFYATPQLGADGAVDVVLDLDVNRPDGSSSVHAADSPCYTGPLNGNPANVMLCESSLLYTADPGDLAGKWEVKVLLKDKQRGVSLPLKTSFELVDDEDAKEEPLKH